MKRIVFGTLFFYQRIFSPDHSWVSRFFPQGFCRFYPTCSAYAQGTIKKYGIVRGGVLAIGRLGRCHPWHAGGIDPVP